MDTTDYDDMIGEREADRQTEMRARLSSQQRLIVNTPGVTLEGFDEAGRPVVSAMAGIPNQLRRWALTKVGDPTDIRGVVR